MTRTIVRGIAWLASASTLLTLGFLGLVYGASLLARRQIDPESVRSMQVALVIYARIVLAKGLLPQLFLSLLLWPLVERLFGLRARGRWPTVVGIVACAAIASGIVIPTLMTTDLPGLPAVRFRSLGHVSRTVAEMTAAVSAALWVSGGWVDRLLPELRNERGADS